MQCPGSSATYRFLREGIQSSKQHLGKFFFFPIYGFPACEVNQLTFFIAIHFAQGGAAAIPLPSAEMAIGQCEDFGFV